MKSSKYLTISKVEDGNLRHIPCEITKTIFDGIVPHIFLPKKLPQSQPTNIATDESNLLSLTTEIIATFNVQIPASTYNLFKTWSALQCESFKLNPLQLSESLASIQKGQMLALYLRGQNCGICLSRVLPEENLIVMSTFAASLKNELVISSPADVQAVYPEQSIKIPYSHLLTSDTFSEQLSFMHSAELEMSMPKSKKSGNIMDETRNVPDTNLISEWIAAALSNENSTICSDTEFPKIVKTVRDDVLWKSSLLPFRRSGFWMTIKVVLQLNLKLELGDAKGKFMYKLLMIHIMIKVCTFWTSGNPINISLALQMLSKVARRLEKLKLHLTFPEITSKTSNLMQLYNYTQRKAEQIIKQVRGFIETKINRICNADQRDGRLKPLSNLNFEQDIIHTAKEVQKFITKRKAEINIKDNTLNLLRNPTYVPRHRAHISRFPDTNILSFLDVKQESAAGFILRDIENWVNINLEKFVFSAEQIRELAFKYSEKAILYYKDDPLGASQMILALLKIIQVVDRKACAKFPLLSEHRCGINKQIIQELLLPSRIDLERAEKLESYFFHRNQSVGFPSLIEEETVSPQSFSARFAANNGIMQQVREQILYQTEENILKKKKELQNLKTQQRGLQIQIDQTDHEYTMKMQKNGHSKKTHKKKKKCRKCILQTQMDSLRINVYEKPLRNEIHYQNAVVFELLIPAEIACLRDVLHLLTFEFCTSNSPGSVSGPSQLTIEGTWSLHPELKIHHRNNFQKSTVHLGSTVKLFSKSHFNSGHPDKFNVTEGDINNIIVDCCYNCTFYGKIRESNYKLSKKLIQESSVKHLCTFQVERGSQYEKLQWTLKGTNHSQNEVLARQSECPQNLSLSEYVEFGTIRAGHRLQIRNIYRAIETNKLSFKNPSVLNLLLQSLWEAGPTENRSWCREPHQDFLNPEFTEKMINLLLKFLHFQENNWNDFNNLLLVAMITVRIIELSSENSVIVKAVGLLMTCRYVSWKWISEIEAVLSKSMESMELRNNLIDVAACCSLTFFVDIQTKSYHMMFSTVNEIPGQNYWLRSIVTQYSNSTLNSSVTEKLPVNRRNLHRMVRRVGINIEKALIDTISLPSQNLNDFATTQLAGAIGGTFDLWRPHLSPADQVYYTKLTEKDGDIHWIQVDLLVGRFLLDGQPISRLPDAITNHAEFQRVFSGVIFEVHATKDQKFCTNRQYYGCNYYFHIRNNNLIVTEIDESGNSSELVPPSKLQDEFPFLLIQKCSHWWNRQKQIINFRPKNFNDPLFFSTDSIDYTFNCDSKLLKENKGGRYFVDITSSSFTQISIYLNRFEDEKYCHAFLTKNDPNNKFGEIPMIEVELPRNALHFRLDKKFQLLSQEYDGKKVCLQQALGCFIGLQNGLLLEDCDSTCGSQKLLIVPHGKIESEVEDERQKVNIVLEKLREPPSFTYEVDEHFRQLKAGKSYAAWFYLAHLHSVTSCPFPDPFTGMTGMEKSLQILQSGRCWSSESFDEESLETLTEIKKLSPKRSFYPEHCKNMQSINWPSHISCSATHEMYLPLINQLIKESKELEFLYSSSSESDVVLPTIHDKNCLYLQERAYWRYLCYDTNSRINETFEDNMLQKEFIPKTVNIAKYDSNLKATKIIAALAHSWTFFVPAEGLDRIVNLLITNNAELKGETSINFESVDIKEWFSLDLKNQWINLYNFAREVQSKKLHSTWALLLSSLVYCGKNHLEDLLILHVVATNPKHFRNIKPPSYSSYSKPQQNQFDRETIKRILHNNKTTLEDYLSAKGFWNFDSISSQDMHRKVELSNGYKISITSQINNLTAVVENGWPCSRCSPNIYQQSFPLIYTEYAIQDIDHELANWYANHELEVFIRQVGIMLAHLEILENGHKQMYPKEWVPQVVDIPPKKKFYIDFEKKMIKSFPNSATVNHMIPDVERIFKSGNLICPRNYISLLDQMQFYRNEKYFYWRTLEQLMIPINEEYLVQSGLYPRIVPTTMIQKLIDPKLKHCVEFRPVLNLIGCCAVLFSLEMRASRIAKMALGGLQAEVALQRELETLPHENWSPAENPEWLLFELEMNLTIRRIQVDVAKQMINPPGGKHSVMQLNMGEGKTSVIVPILAATLADGYQLCRLTVLKSLFQTNLSSLRHCLGGMLNRRVYTFPCRRDTKIGVEEVQTIIQLLKVCQEMKGIVMTLPEYRLSFQLKIYENARREDFETCKLFLDAHNWLHSKARDILDESDEILNAKYQLIYTVGEQLPPDGGNFRWTIIQKLMKLLPSQMKRLWKKYGNDMIEIDETFDTENGPEIFLPCRLLNDDIYDEMIQSLADEFLKGNTSIQFIGLPNKDKKVIKDFLVDTNISSRDHSDALNLFEENMALRDTILILAGYFKYEVLRLAFSKRWRVNYGVNNSGHRKMAVPFKAKDVAAEMTEFGHPDVAICLTHLSYYYSGLADEQLWECFRILEKLQNPSEQYMEWISKISPEKVHTSIKNYTGINLKNSSQMYNHVFPVLKKNMYVIDFWLNHTVFPREAKQFSQKMMCTAWDLVSKEQKLTISGFSGTNDSQLLLPLTIVQNDLNELQDTNEEVRETLLKSENDNYVSLPPNISGQKILQMLSEKEIPVLIDAGALMLEFNNEQVATEWLKITREHSPGNKIKAAVYFDVRNILMVTDGQNRQRELELSPYRERLDVCIIYLDDVHTRGTDLKFPQGSKACVTLAGGITRDKTVQACMRMRLLGKGHTISFWGSQEADNGIRKVCQLEMGMKIHTTHIIDWITNNSSNFEKDGLVHWSAAGYNYFQKLAAHKALGGRSDNGSLLNLSHECTDKEIYGLMSIYGERKNEELISSIVAKRFQFLTEKYLKISPNSVADELSTQRDHLLQRLQLHIPKEKRFAQLLDEEQEKELEHELEAETHVQRPMHYQPYPAELDLSVKELLETGSLAVLYKLIESKSVIQLPFALKNTSLWPIAQEDGWEVRIFATKDFVSVIHFWIDNVDEFLRPVHWIACVDIKEDFKTYRVLLVLSPLEANSFLPIFKTSNFSTLHMYAARMHPNQDNLLNTPQLQYPVRKFPILIDGRYEPQLSVFAGAIYFKSKKEQDDYCNFLGIIPQPRSFQEQSEFEKGNISTTGFLLPQNRSKISKIIAAVCKFKKQPNELIRKIVERRQGELPLSSHVSMIIMESKKPFHLELTNEE